jgi:uncharacterized membrane protein YidH (DUF202 family)
MMIPAALLLFQEVISEADANRVLLKVVLIGLTIFLLAAGALYAFFRSFEARDRRAAPRTLLLLGTLIAVVITACILLLRIAITTTKY